MYMQIFESHIIQIISYIIKILYMPCNCGSDHITSPLLQLLSESPTVATMLRPLVCASIAGRVPHTNKALHTQL